MSEEKEPWHSPHKLTREQIIEIEEHPDGLGKSYGERLKLHAKRHGLEPPE